MYSSMDMNEILELNRNLTSQQCVYQFALVNSWIESYKIDQSL